MHPGVNAFFDESTNTITYVVAEPQGNACAVIDSVLDYDPKSGRTSTASADKLIAFLNDHGLRVEWILETHAHADHLTAAPYIKEKIGGKIAIGEHIKTVQATFKTVFNLEPGFATDGSQFDHLLKDDERFSIGALEGRVIHTPGHTPACLTYVIGDAAFVGDTLFMPDYGTARCDFPAAMRPPFMRRSRSSSRCQRRPVFSCAMTTRRRDATYLGGRADARPPTSMTGSANRNSCACARRATPRSRCRCSSLPSVQLTSALAGCRRRKRTASPISRYR